jgi:hypothetical protein
MKQTFSALLLSVTVAAFGSVSDYTDKDNIVVWKDPSVAPLSGEIRLTPTSMGNYLSVDLELSGDNLFFASGAVQLLYF